MNEIRLPEANLPGLEEILSRGVPPLSAPALRGWGGTLAKRQS